MVAHAGEIAKTMQRVGLQGWSLRVDREGRMRRVDEAINRISRAPRLAREKGHHGRIVRHEEIRLELIGPDLSQWREPASRQHRPTRGNSHAHGRNSAASHPGNDTNTAIDASARLSADDSPNRGVTTHGDADEGRIPSTPPPTMCSPATMTRTPYQKVKKLSRANRPPNFE
jgi:hypothetical protein